MSYQERKLYKKKEKSNYIQNYMKTKIKEVKQNSYQKYQIHLSQEDYIRIILTIRIKKNNYKIFIQVEVRKHRDSNSIKNN
jgi:hypothetical protein